MHNKYVFDMRGNAFSIYIHCNSIAHQKHDYEYEMLRMNTKCVK